MDPSFDGLQRFEIYQVTSNELKKQIVVGAKDQTFIEETSLLLVFCANPSYPVKKFGKRLNYSQCRTLISQLHMHSLRYLR